MENKKISFYWESNSMSWLRFLTIYSFRKYNPDWDIYVYLSNNAIKNKLWGSKEIQDFFGYKGKNYFNQLRDLNVSFRYFSQKDSKGAEISPSQKSNFFKWNLLATEGGFYADMDILFLRSINDIYEKTKQYDMGITYTSHYSIGFMFSNGNNSFFKKVYEECCKSFARERYQGAGVVILNNNWKTLHCIEKLNQKVYNIPTDLLYKYNSEKVEKIHEKDSKLSLNESCIGLHWYAGHELSQKENTKLNEKNYKEENTLLRRTIQKILEDSTIHYDFDSDYFSSVMNGFNKDLPKNTPKEPTYTPIEEEVPVHNRFPERTPML